MRTKSEQQKHDDEQTVKTAQLLGAGLLTTLPIYCADSRLGLMSSLAVVGGLMYGFHETGKNRRVLANSANNVMNFFGGPSNTIDTIAHNVMEGGASYHDELSAIVGSKGPNK